MAESLKNRTVKGLSWCFSENVANQLIRFVIGVILARLLTPDDYGLVAISLIFISIFEGIVDGGFTNALIQKKNVTANDYNTVFVTNLFVSVLLYIILYFSAPYIAEYFHSHILVMPIRIVSSIIIIDAFVIVQKAKLTKIMDFKSQAYISVISSVLSGLLGIIMAISRYGFWSLIWQQIARHLINTTLFWIINKGGVQLKFYYANFSTLFSFGSKLLLSDIIVSVYYQLKDIVIGKVYSPATLGQYSRASQFSSLFSSTLMQITQKVTFPALASIQDDDMKLVNAYRLLTKSIMFVTFNMLLCLAAIAKPMIFVTVGNQWMEAVPYLQLLCISAIFIPLLYLNTNVLKVKGRSDLCLKLEIIKKSIGLIPIILGILFNIYWMLIGSIIEMAIAYYINCFYSSGLINYNLKEQILDMVPSFVIAFVVSLILYSLTFLGWSYYILFAVQLSLALILIVSISEIFQIDSYLEIKQIIKSVINRVKTI